ncbi:hypothetical protein [Microbispora sp. GKU 823]|uniref:hypothetical protein n=1 Tax=Microbispora sp. GKU 823 TaxID=1652100 RepID=UPI00211975B4|nr:hypothetical protein [Microbispora sp. GKU 823]
MKILQAAKAEFDPLPFDETAAREYGQLWTAVIASGRNPRPRTADLVIACVAIANQLPLYTCNPKGLQRLGSPALSGAGHSTTVGRHVATHTPNLLQPLGISTKPRQGRTVPAWASE